jgi:hypothetical protein
MRFVPKSETEVANLIAPGICDFEVLDAEDTVSKKGNDMAVLKIRVSAPNGQEKIITDYLVAIDSVAYKIRHFASATGLMDAYDSGTMTAEQMKGQCGQCKVGVKVDESGQYPDKNIIQDYVKSNTDKKAKPPAATTKPKDDMDDDIPF